MFTDNRGNPKWGNIIIVGVVVVAAVVLVWKKPWQKHAGLNAPSAIALVHQAPSIIPA